jgi:hypothetical protein
LPYDKACKLLLSLEAAEKEVKGLAAGEKPVLQVHARQSRNQPSNFAHHSKGQSCHRCGGSHDAAKCRFRQAECHFCHKKGHIASVCRQKAKRQSKPGTRPTHTLTEQGEVTPAEYPMYQCHSPNSKPLSRQVKRSK